MQGRSPGLCSHSPPGRCGRCPAGAVADRHTAGGSGPTPFLRLPLSRACGRVTPASASVVSAASCSVWDHATRLHHTDTPITRIASQLQAGMESRSQSSPPR